jgi:hypothetical protein
MRRYAVLFISISLALSFPAFGLTKASSGYGAGMKVVPQEIKEENKRLKYSINAKYPQIEGAKSAGAANFNNAVKALIMKEVGEFKKSIRGWDTKGIGSEVGSYLETDYEVMIDNGNLISVAFGENSYYAGAAHPNHNALVVNYDLKSARTLRLAELFKPGSKYLSVISKYCIADLKKQMGGDADDRWIREGAGGSLKNYKNWTVTEQGLTILFDPYQVASYAAGPQKVDIPYAALKGIVAPSGPLAAFVK